MLFCGVRTWLLLKKKRLGVQCCFVSVCYTSACTRILLFCACCGQHTVPVRILPIDQREIRMKLLRLALSLASSKKQFIWLNIRVLVCVLGHIFCSVRFRYSNANVKQEAREKGAQTLSALREILCVAQNLYCYRNVELCLRIQP